MRTESKVSLAILLVLGIVFLLFMTQRARRDAPNHGGTGTAAAPKPRPPVPGEPIGRGPGRVEAPALPPDVARGRDAALLQGPSLDEAHNPGPGRVEGPVAGRVETPATTPHAPAHADAGPPREPIPSRTPGTHAVASAAPPTGPAPPPAAGPEPEEPLVPLPPTTRTTGEHAASGADPPASAPAGGARTHLVQEGDSLWALSLQYYGKGKYWMVLRDANKDVIEDENSLPVGKALRIPAAPETPRATTAARPSPEEGPAPGAGSTGRRGTAPRTDGAPAGNAPGIRIADRGKRLYTVQKGDTLERIARRVLGTRERMADLQEKNQIANPNEIWEGQVLVLPE